MLLSIVLLLDPQVTLSVDKKNISKSVLTEFGSDDEPLCTALPLGHLILELAYIIELGLPVAEVCTANSPEANSPEFHQEVNTQDMQILLAHRIVSFGNT